MPTSKPGFETNFVRRYRLRLWLQVKRPEGSASGQNVRAPESPAPAPLILNIDPLKFITFDPLQKNPAIADFSRGDTRNELCSFLDPSQYLTQL